MNGLPKSDGAARPNQSSLQSDITLLQSLLSQDETVEDSDPDITELLRRLEAADGVATGLEDRLDEIIGGLDNLLGTLETGEQQVGTSQETATEDDSVVQEEQTRVVVGQQDGDQVGGHLTQL